MSSAVRPFELSWISLRSTPGAATATTLPSMPEYESSHAIGVGSAASQRLACELATTMLRSRVVLSMLRLVTHGSLAPVPGAGVGAQSGTRIPSRNICVVS